MTETKNRLIWVEDQPEDFNQISNMLISCGYRILKIKNYSELVDFLDDNDLQNSDVFLIEPTIPGQQNLDDGLDSWQLLSQLPPERTILFTCSTDPRLHDSLPVPRGQIFSKLGIRKRLDDFAAVLNHLKPRELAEV